MGKPVKIDTLARNFIRLCGYEPEKDIKIIYTGLRPGEKLYEELLTSEEGLQATKHNKIFVAKLEDTNWIQFRQELFRLKTLLIDGSCQDVISQIGSLVPSYTCSQELINKQKLQA